MKLKCITLRHRERERVCVEIVRHVLVPYAKNYLNLSRLEAKEFLTRHGYTDAEITRLETNENSM
jgi:hypothetical protein